MINNHMLQPHHGIITNANSLMSKDSKKLLLNGVDMYNQVGPSCYNGLHRLQWLSRLALSFDKN